MSRKGFALIFVVVIVAIVAVLGGWYLTQRQVTSDKSQGSTAAESQAPTTASQVDTSGWKTYRNERYGFDLKYPSGISIQDREDNEILRLEAEKDKEFNTQMGIKVYSIPNFSEKISGQYNPESQALSLLELPTLAQKLGTNVVGGFVGDSPYGEYSVSIKHPRENTGINIFGVIVGEEDKQLFRQILSTFKFIQR